MVSRGRGSTGGQDWSFPRSRHLKGYRMKFYGHEFRQSTQESAITLPFSPRYYDLSPGTYTEYRFKYEIVGKYGKPAHVDPELTTLEEALDWLRHEIERNR